LGSQEEREEEDVAILKELDQAELGCTTTYITLCSFAKVREFSTS
jgi:hypothetical protein